MINQEVIDQHAEEAAFLWTQRDHATRAPQYGLKDLAKLDERVDAHIDGLRVAADAGWAAALAQLNQGRGEVFAAATLAFESRDSTRVTAVLDVGCTTPLLARGLISALGWLGPHVALTEARSLLISHDAEVRRAGIAGMAIHRMDPGRVLAEAVGDPHARLSGRAMKAAAELGRVDQLPDIVSRLSDPDEECRFWAAWSAIRLGDRGSDGAIPILQTVAEAPGPMAALATDMAVRVMSVEDGHQWRNHLATRADTSAFAVLAAGAIGDPAAVPELIAAMEDPKLARAAGGAFSMISGADFSLDHLEGDALFPEDEDSSGGDSDLPWLAPPAVAGWWAKRSSAYSPGFRYLCGQPITDQSLREVLINGRQTQRVAAALELALRYPSEILFETRERAQWQQKKVRQWNS